MSRNIGKYFAAFLDYIWVLTIYVVLAFSLSSLVDGRLLPPFDEKKAEEESNIELASRIILHLAIQGFFVIVITEIMQNIYSPFTHIYGYNPKSDIGTLIRNPSIIAIILFNLSKSLQGRLYLLFHRFNKK